ncbi:MAG: hypothetical protein JSU01_22605 [Bacteroidetes bacterium]|nr:hypothetical protein [Bacteroidota bacterium]
MKAAKNPQQFSSRRIFRFGKTANWGLNTTDPTTITINTNTGTTATTVTYIGSAPKANR